MACAGTKPTLSLGDDDLARFAQSLGLLRLAIWYALELSTLVPAPLTTGPSLTRELVSLLEDAGAIVGPDQSALARRSLYEPITWGYPFAWSSSGHLQSVLRASLEELSTGDRATQVKLEMWEALADAEIETYLTHLLRRHGLESISASHVAEEMSEEWSCHCLGRRRYLVWFGTRGAAAALLRTGMNHAAAQQAMIDEMCRRSRWLVQKGKAQEIASNEYCFVPDRHWRRPNLLQVLLDTVLPIGQSYWTDLPRRHMRGLVRNDELS